ncbi:MAG: aldo/keto reductase [Saprospiraceae bacterium]
MIYKTLGKTNLDVSILGLGTWAFGNNVYGGVDKKEAIQIIRHAYEHGITLFDSAPQYGTKKQDGVAEIVLGEAIKSFRDKIVVQTKFGRNFSIENGAPQFYKKRVIESVDESLTRLGTDYIDVLFFHSPFSKIEIHDDVWEGIDNVIQSGKVRQIGHSISMFKDTEHLSREWADENKISVIQVVLNLLNREADALIKDLSKKNIGFVARECMANGFLSGAITKDTVFPPGTLNARYSQAEIQERVEQVALFEILFNSSITKMSQAAMRAVMDEPGISTVLSGAKSIKELDDSLIAVEAPPYSTEMLAQTKKLLLKNFEPA